MARLFSYVVDHDCGIAPNPFGGYCTLAKCKYSKSGRKNVIESAKVGDWVIGTGGADVKKSAGHGKLIYAMQVDETLTLGAYYTDRRFCGRQDNDTPNRIDRFALISQHFFYFGRNAISVDDIPQKHLAHPLEKKGPGFRSDFSQEFIDDFVKWLESRYRVGAHGLPCGHGTKTLIQIQA